MPIYTQENTLRLAKRYRNAKRTYLLVNPLQAKHLPVSPGAALDMMEALGRQLAGRYPGASLVVGFAETATAIGAAAARCLGEGCVYLHTTREPFSTGEHWISFCEEHSHAVEQTLCADHLEAYFGRTDTVIFLDDEISTGKTLRNMIAQLRERYPALGEKTLVAASILNRVSPEDEALLHQAGICCEYLVKLPQQDYTAAVADIAVEEACPAEMADVSFRHRTLPGLETGDPRRGAEMGTYARQCGQAAQMAAEALELPAAGRVLVLGTEECMYPALILGAELERRGYTVRCHATTRSPIGVCDDPGYPIRCGVKLPSFYDPARTTYLYDLDRYDAAVVVSDTPRQDTAALAALTGALTAYGTEKIYYVRRGSDVWYL